MAHEVMIEQLGKPAVKKDVPYAACEKGPLGMKKAVCARWIRMPVRGSLWLLPPGPDQVRNLAPPKPIRDIHHVHEVQRLKVYLNYQRATKPRHPAAKLP